MSRKSAPSPPSRTRRSAPVPAGFGTVTAYLNIDRCGDAMEFYKRAFGARELIRRTTSGGRILHGRMRFGDTIVMMSDGAAPEAARSDAAASSNVMLHIYSPDVDRLWSRAVSAGAKVAMPLQNQFWGERYGQLLDPFGQRWSLAQRVRMSVAERRLLEEQAQAMLDAAAQAGNESVPEPG